MTSPTPFDLPAHDAPPDRTAGGDAEPIGEPLVGLDSAILRDVNVELKARLGDVRLTVEALLALRAGSVVTVETKLADLVELRLNDAVVARGEIVAVGDNFGIRIVEVAART
jgi:flagellar motor switch protein FliN/FliY